ncbi:hypothetical protein, partial [Haemophilus parainfluenzae]|uniref:hypothetical protein n=1 Tax=Haemophilus parainfluenzae TaxID=729 RepID=UPI001788B5FB
DGDGVATPGKVVNVNGIDRQEFQGQAIKGRAKTNDYNGSNPTFHVWQTNDNTIPQLNNTLTNTNDTVNQSNGGLPSDIMMDPIKLFTED